MAFSLTRFRGVALIAAAGYCCGCKHAPSDADAMRAGILQHLAPMKSLNMNAMDLVIDRISYEGSQAHVFVTFRPKASGPPDATMQVAYVMEKRNTGWQVVKTEAVGGAISHPESGAAANAQPGQASAPGDTPNFRELTSPATGAAGSLPPGHPPVATNPPSKPALSNSKPQ